MSSLRRCGFCPLGVTTFDSQRKSTHKTTEFMMEVRGTGVSYFPLFALKSAKSRCQAGSTWRALKAAVSLGVILRYRQACLEPQAHSKR